MPLPSYCLPLSQQEFNGARLKRSAEVQRWRLASLADCSLVGRQTKVIILYWGTRDGTCGQDTRGTNVFQLRAPCHSAFERERGKVGHTGRVVTEKSAAVSLLETRKACVTSYALYAWTLLHWLRWSELYYWLLWPSCYCTDYDDRTCTTGYCGRVVTVLTTMIGIVLLVIVAELLLHWSRWSELYYWLLWPSCHCIHYDDWNCITGYSGQLVTVFIMMIGLVLLVTVAKLLLYSLWWSELYHWLLWLSCYCIHYDNRNCTTGCCGQIVTVFIMIIGTVLLITVANLLLHSLWWFELHGYCGSVDTSLR